MFGRDVDVEVEHNDQSLLLFVEQLFVQQFEWVELFVVELMNVPFDHHLLFQELNSYLQLVELVMVVQLYDHNVLDNTVRIFDHFVLYRLSSMKYNVYHNEEIQVF
jgi:hypothetical protein